MKTIVKLLAVAALAVTTLALASPGGAATRLDAPRVLVVYDLAITDVTPEGFRVRNLGRLGTGSFVVRVSGGWRTDGACNAFVPGFVRHVGGLAAGGSVWIPVQAANTTRRAYADYGNLIREFNERNNGAFVPGDYLC